MNILWKGRYCLDQNSFEPSIELVGMYEDKEVRAFIDVREMEEYKIITGRDLIEEKKKELSKKLI